MKKKDKDILGLKENIDSLNDLINSVNMESGDCRASVATAKIMDLCRKNRQLVSELENIKSKYIALETINSKLEKEVYQNSSKCTLTEQTKKVPCCSSAFKLDSLNNQLITTKQKLFEALNQIAELKSNLKWAQKCVQLETGKIFNMNNFSAPSSTMRGRAQQIVILQNKIAALKEKIENTSQGNEPIKQELYKLEASRKVEFQNSTQKINELNIIVEDQKKKIAILKARNKTLSDDTMNYKLKTLNLLEKFGICDNSIAVLQQKSTIQRFQHEGRVMDLQKKLDLMQKAMDQMMTDYDQVKIKLHNLETLNQEKDNTISKLKTVIEKLETDLKNMSGGFLFSCREFQKEEFVALLDALEGEKKGLLKFITDLNGHLEQEREKTNDCINQLYKQRVKYGQLETKMKELVKEQETQCVQRKRKPKALEYFGKNTRISTLVFQKSDPCQSDDGPELQIEGLKNKLDFAKERITFLEEKISVNTDERKADLDNFKQIIGLSRDFIVKMISCQQSKSQKITFDNEGVSKAQDTPEFESKTEVD